MSVLSFPAFPIYVHLGPLAIHPHFFFEMLAYTLGFQFYRWLSRRAPASAQVPTAYKLWFLIACVGGAALGARVLAWLETPYDVLTGQWIMPGKTIVGGLLGGWIGVEAVKAYFGMTRRTGDTYVLPLVFGIALGRVGCFLTGLADHTYGVATTLPWAVDFGDGILRHPTQLYESLLLLVSGGLLWAFRHRLQQQGLMFRAFMAIYLGFRLGVEFIKPSLKIYGGLSAIQWACLLGLVALTFSLWRLYKRAPVPERFGIVVENKVGG